MASSDNSVVTTPSVSIIIPCRNEAQFISRCLDSIILNDFPHEKLEVLVVDGMSDDGTRRILEQYVDRFPFVRVLKNQKRITPVAFNIGINQAKGDLIMIMSAHATYEESVVSRCVSFSEKYNADNVGGIWKIHPRNDTLINRAIVRTLSHPFGVGGAYYRTLSETHTEPKWVDTAAYGCYKKEVFEKIGLFNEQLTHSQDMEFNLRLKNAGGRTLLVPGNVINYYARSDFISFCKHNFRNGLWVILPFLYTDFMPVAWRHLVPLLFILSLVVTLGLGLLWHPLLWVCLAILVAYGILNLAASLQIACQERDPRYAVLMPVAFGMLHFCYGIGSLWGVIKLSVTPPFWRKLLKDRS